MGEMEAGGLGLGVQRDAGRLAEILQRHLLEGQVDGVQRDGVDRLGDLDVDLLAAGQGQLFEIGLQVEPIGGGNDILGKLARNLVESQAGLGRGRAGGQGRRQQEPNREGARAGGTNHLGIPLRKIGATVYPSFHRDQMAWRTG